jgi:hypothetical protein
MEGGRVCHGCVTSSRLGTLDPVVLVANDPVGTNYRSNDDSRDSIGRKVEGVAGVLLRIVLERVDPEISSSSPSTTPQRAVWSLGPGGRHPAQPDARASWSQFRLGSRSARAGLPDRRRELRACPRRSGGGETGDWLGAPRRACPPFHPHREGGGFGDRHRAGAEPVPFPSVLPLFVHPFSVRGRSRKTQPLLQGVLEGSSSYREIRWADLMVCCRRDEAPGLFRAEDAQEAITSTGAAGPVTDCGRRSHPAGA